ncbi:MAG TPA: hypothetical protein VF221_11680 [Chloroflexota bacterium]
MRERENKVIAGQSPFFWRLSSGSRDGRARGLLRIWPLWEWIARRIWLTRPIPGARYGVFTVHMTRYRGDRFLLPDGSTIRPGDQVGELHFNNRVMVEVTRRRIWDLLPALEADLRSLALWITGPDFPTDVTAFYGVTLLSSGARRLGFTARERPVTVRARLDRFFLSGLLALYSRQGLSRLRLGSTYGTYPQEVWMSRAELLRRYG